MTWYTYFSCLADIIFLIYVYQRWIYPVDKKRVNEFGFAGEDGNQASSSPEAITESSPEAITSSPEAITEEEKKTN